MNVPAELSLRVYDVEPDWLVERRGDTLYIAIEGSDCATDWRRNLEFLVTSNDTHAGFQNYATRLMAEMWTSDVDVMACRNLVLCGHSLGGAVATIIANDIAQHRINVSLVTFGSPRPGGNRFAKRFTVPHKRYTHGLDAVPHMPPAAFGFRHTVPPTRLREPHDSLLRSVGDHDMKLYLALAS